MTQTSLFALLRAALLALAAASLAARAGASPTGRVCVDAPGNALCLSWSVGADNITFAAECRPPPGQTA